MAREKNVASPGHKLGQIVGNVLEDVLRSPLLKVAVQHGLYCDCKGLREGVRKGKKVTWRDAKGTSHDLDYVFERGGSRAKKGVPVAFIESAWRRYTKQSRNKSGEIQAALQPLMESYPSTRFLGVIIAGEYSAGGLDQLRRNGIDVLHVSFDTIAAVFKRLGGSIEYPEHATAGQKAALQKLFGIRSEYRTVEDAIAAVSETGFGQETDRAKPHGYEAIVDYTGGSTVRGHFGSKEELLDFLRRVQ
jgi:hypothetical protein